MEAGPVHIGTAAAAALVGLAENALGFWSDRAADIGLSDFERAKARREAVAWRGIVNTMVAEVVHHAA